MNPLLKKILIIGAPLLLRKLFRGNKVFKKTGLVLLLVMGGIWLFIQYPFTLTQPDVSANYPNDSQSEKIAQSDIRSLYDAQRSGVMVSTVAHVTRILKDDNDGSRHQRFLIETPGGLSLLVAHNIDLAPRVPLAKNDQVSIHGQYEWNNKGGVLHWTHHDPNKRHPGGWIMYQGKKYE
ncbi:MAG: DUF3465 domain-containing protein [Gammaproteobacteria bacterium]